MTSLQRNVILVFAAAVVVRLAFHFGTGFVADDAFITFRYAKNLVEGHGFVYNPGEPVLGTSTPLFTLILALFAAFSVPPVETALFVSVVCSGLTATVLYRFARSLRFTRLAFLPALLYILWPRSVPAEVSGMETALFTLLVTAAFYFQHRRLEYYALGMATLAAATRPEGGLLLLLLVAYNWYCDRERWLSYLVIPVILLGPWLAFACYYFGSPIPSAIGAKLALYSRFGALPWWQNLIYLTGWHHPLGPALTLFAVVGAYWLNRKQNFGWLEIIWLLGMIAFFTFSRTLLFFWYIVPINPIYILFICAAFPFLYDQAAFLRKTHAVVTAVLTIGLAVVLLGDLYRRAPHFQHWQSYSENVGRRVGLYLFQHAERKKDAAAVEGIGYIGYYSKLRIIDRDGLISPEAIPYNADGRYLDLVLDHEPEWVGAIRGSPISGFLEDSLFLREYALRKVFAGGTESEYYVYSRLK